MFFLRCSYCGKKIHWWNRREVIEFPDECYTVHAHCEAAAVKIAGVAWKAHLAQARREIA
jgi:hypothetical protein